ncbi:MAG: helix-turn-helix transcriptional regulator [Spirochaetales bacterium]|nr:helix-turn-helix transcriptional regulator [Spirochaetales bacterium]
MDKHGLTDPALPLSVEKSDEGRRVSLQSERSQIFYLLSGTLYKKSAGGFLDQPAPVIVVIPPGRGIRLRLSDDSAFYRVLLESWLFNEYSIRHWEKSFLFFFREKTAFFRLPDNRPVLFERIYIDLLDEYTRRKPGYRDIIRVKLSELFINMARLKTRDVSRVDVSVSARGITEIIGFLEEHYTRTISLEQIADFAGYSPAYLSRYFRKKTGVCLFAYINKIRIQKACKLLKHTDKTILEIAYSVGYKNISFFNRCFKKIINMSPAEFRKGF